MTAGYLWIKVYLRSALFPVRDHPRERAKRSIVGEHRHRHRRHRRRRRRGGGGGGELLFLREADKAPGE